MTNPDGATAQTSSPQPSTQEYDAPIIRTIQTALTPMEVLHQRFATAWRGYHKEEVHAFLGQLSQQLESSLAQRSALNDEIQELRQQVEQYKNSEDELRRTIVAAERISHELKEQSRQEAALIISEAENKSFLLAEQSANREREALIMHDQRLREMETTFGQRRSQLEQLYQQQEHALEQRARDRSAQLEREFSARYAELSGRLTSAHAEYANFMAQYRAVSQAFAQAASTQLLPENPALLSAESAELSHYPGQASARIPAEVLAPEVLTPTEAAPAPITTLLVEDQSF